MQSISICRSRRREGNMASTAALFLLLLAIPAALATNYTVGDSSGWDTGVDYTTWASGKTFKIGDNLIFTYTSNHGVDVVQKADYDSCNTGNALQTFSGGSTTIPLTSAGPHYYTCPTFGHCGQGMKLAVNVSGSGGSSPATPTTPSSPGTPATPSTPSSPTTKTPSGASGLKGWALGASLLWAALVALLG